MVAAAIAAATAATATSATTTYQVAYCGGLKSNILGPAAADASRTRLIMANLTHTERIWVLKAHVPNLRCERWNKETQERNAPAPTCLRLVLKKHSRCARPISMYGGHATHDEKVRRRPRKTRTRTTRRRSAGRGGTAGRRSATSSCTRTTAAACSAWPENNINNSKVNLIEIVHPRAVTLALAVTRNANATRPAPWHGYSTSSILYCAVFARSKFVRWRLACDQQKNPLFVLLSTLNV